MTSSEQPPPAPTEPTGKILPAYGPGAPPQSAKAHFRLRFAEALHSPLTISLTATGAIAAFTGLTIALGVGLGLLAAAGVVAIALIIVALIARERAEDDFFISYASARGLAHTEKAPDLPELTPLLGKGDRRGVEHTMVGALPGGLNGTLGLYTYEEDHYDSKGNRQTTYFHFTVLLTEVAKSLERCPKLFCQRRSGLRILDGVEDKFRSARRIELESEALDRRYEIFCDEGADQNWMRQLFSPTFIVWLAESSPDDFAFELLGGNLCVNVKGQLRSAVELDSFCEAAMSVVARLREELAESALPK